jgi:hypothetical protein
MSVLNDREKDVLMQRRLADEPVTLEELSESYGVSPRAHPPDRGPRLREAAGEDARSGPGKGMAIPAATPQRQRMQRRCRLQKVAIFPLAGMLDRRQFHAIDEAARLDVVAGKETEARAVQIDRPIAIAQVVGSDGIVAECAARVETGPVLRRGRSGKTKKGKQSRGLFHGHPVLLKCLRSG